MDYQKKFYIALGVTVIGALLLLTGKDMVQVQYTPNGIVFGNTLPMIAGFVLFAGGAPFAYYFFNRMRTPKSREQREIEALLQRHKDK